MGKVMARKAQKEAAKLQQQQQQEVRSVSTATPSQIPEPTPRDVTLPSNQTENNNVIIGDNGVPELSPTEFLKTLERDGLLER
jgi:hypothetical protein